MNEETERVVIRDNRKIDPVTGEAKKPAASPGTGDAGGFGDGPADGVGEGAADMVSADLLDERTRDLQRLQAEYANYRRRSERERLAAGDVAVGRALTGLLPVVDDIDRARVHGDLSGAFKAVADKLDSVLTTLGLTPFGTVGDPFDPALHEAVLHDESDAVTEPTCTTVMRPGFRYQERLLRPAMVGVTAPIAAGMQEPTAARDQAEPAGSAADEASGAHEQGPTGTGVAGAQGDELESAVRDAATPANDN